jgi:tetratricopeptide (TPR) repeat protein
MKSRPHSLRAGASGALSRLSALALLVFALAPCAGARQDGGGDVRRISIPGESWSMEVRLPGFGEAQDDLRPDGKGRRIMAGIEEKGYVVSIFLEPIPDGKSATELRDLDASGQMKSPLKPTDSKSADYKGIPTFEYIIKEFRGQQVNQKHFNAYLVYEGFWAHIHLSKMLFEPGDDKLFYAIVDSAKFVKGGAPAAARGPAKGPVADLLGEGSRHFMRGEYAQAVGPYSRALELEKQNPTLPSALWHVLVDNLTMSYGISGDLKRAKETAEYGLSKDPDYPLFHYLLANTYAEMDDLDNAILYLKQAFARRKNVLPGERMPDPATDDSFRRFMKNEKFLAALKEINP